MMLPSACKPLIVMLVVIFLAGRADPACAREWFAATSGKADNSGTKESPWDLGSALSGRQEVRPGDTLWISEGTYRHPDRGAGSAGYVVGLVGQEGNAIQVRAPAGKRVTIDGGLTVQAPATWLSIWNLEILVSENLSLSRTFSEPGSHPRSYDRPWGGLNIHSGKGCQYINLVIHDNAQGISFWSGASDSEVHGCLLYDNGWKAPDRGHGHAIYTQNKDGVKTIESCLMTGGYGYTLHAYGSKQAYVDNYLVRRNVCYNAGPFLIGGGRPSHGIRVSDNVLYRVGMQIGYTAPENEDCEVTDNWIVRGDLQIHRYQRVVNRDNRVLGPGDGRPAVPAQVLVQPYRLDPNRANVVIFNGDGRTHIAVDPAPLLRPGRAFRMMDPRDFYGKPVLTGTYEGRPIEMPIRGEFAAYVLLSDGPQ
jgi:hypothetical protein